MSLGLQIVNIFYSSLVCLFYGKVIIKLIVRIKDKTSGVLNKLKFTILFIIMIIVNLFIIYYNGCICAIFPKAVKQLLIEIAINFILSIVYSLLVNLITVFFEDDKYFIK